MLNNFINSLERMQILTSKVAEERSRTDFRVEQDRLNLLIFLNKNYQTKFELLPLPNSVNNNKMLSFSLNFGYLSIYLTFAFNIFAFCFPFFRSGSPCHRDDNYCNSDCTGSCCNYLCCCCMYCTCQEK